jgi:hypothetical protein
VFLGWNIRASHSYAQERAFDKGRSPFSRLAGKVTRMKNFAFFAAFILLYSTRLSHADANPIEQRDRDYSPRKSLDLAIHGVGVSFGNSPRFTGLRFNLVDSRVEEINGINVTLWKPGKNSDGVIRGIAAGLYSPRAGELSGISIGGLGVVAGSSLSGIAVGGLAVVSGGELGGIGIGGLATVAEGSAAGIMIGGLASVTEGALSGVSVGGLASVTEGTLSGISIGGLAAVAGKSASGIMVGGLASVVEGNFSGIHVSGLASVCDGSMSGISVAGLATVSTRNFSGVSVSGFAAFAQGDISGIALAGGSVMANGDISGITIGVIGAFLKREPSDEDEGTEFSFSYAGTRARNAEWITVHGIDVGVEEKLGGLGAAGISVRADEIEGIALAGALVKARSLTGFSAGAVNYFDEYQAGLSIGLVNFARELNGVQLGIINIAKNNSSPFRVLPIVNAHFE